MSRNLVGSETTMRSTNALVSSSKRLPSPEDTMGDEELGPDCGS